MNSAERAAIVEEIAVESLEQMSKKAESMMANANRQTINHLKFIIDLNSVLIKHGSDRGPLGFTLISMIVIMLADPRTAFNIFEAFDNTLNNFMFSQMSEETKELAKQVKDLIN